MPETRPVEIPAWIKTLFPANPRAAVDFFRPLIDEAILLEIAEADYASDVEEHLKALRPIQAGGEIKEPDFWYPGEVLGLIRWSEPDDPWWKPGSQGLQGHRMRAFCCAVLLAFPDSESNKETLIQLLHSAFVIGDAALTSVTEFLVWRIKGLGRDNDRPFFALAIAAAACFLDPGMDINREEELAAWVLEEEESEREYNAGWDPKYQTAPQLFGLSCSDLRNTRWRALIKRIQECSGRRPLGILLERTRQDGEDRPAKDLPATA